jgi:hypothetical protein
MVLPHIDNMLQNSMGDWEIWFESDTKIYKMVLVRYYPMIIWKPKPEEWHFNVG